MDFTSRQLRGFHLVAQHQSFSRAAEALFITPSGLSLLIRELENQLGFRLFDRTTRHVQLTPLGSDLLAVTRRSVQELDAAMSRLGQTAKGITRSVSVGVTPLVAANVLPQAIREFRGRRPDLRIQLYDGDLKAILRRVEAGKLDMGLGIFQRVPGVRRTPFFRFSLILIRAEQEGATTRASMAWGALDGQSLISLAPDNPTQQLIDQQLASAGIVCPRDMVVNLLDTQIALVEANEGIAIIPSFGLPVARHRKVTMTQLINPVVHLEFHQINNRAKPLSPEAVEFTAFLKSYISRWAGRSGVL
jgi:LysR family transcriptional regulator, carnitine catabolism transcriptional activator